MKVTDDSLEILEAANGVKLCLSGKLDNTSFLAERLLVWKDNVEYFNLSFASPLDIPKDLIKADQNSLQLRESIDAGTNTRFLALVSEAQRRLQSIEVTTATKFLGVPSPFGTAVGEVGAHAKLQIWAIVGSTIQLDIKVELAAYAHVTIKKPKQTQTFALVCVFDKENYARLRIDVDDFNLSLPEFKLSSLDLSGDPKLLDLAQGRLSGAANAFTRLGLNVEVKITPPSNKKLKLALRLHKNSIDWILVDVDSDVNWDKPKRAKLDAEIKFLQNGTAVTIKDLQLSYIGGEANIGNVKVIVSAGPIKLKNGRKRFGPLEVSWQDVALTPKADKDTPLCGEVEFKRLVLRVYDDPDTVLAFQGKVEITPSAARIIELHLIEPDLIKLVTNADKEMARAAGSVIKLAFATAEMAYDKAQELLTILGKIATAVGRSAIFIENVAGEALETVADLVAKGLAAVAELIGEVLKALKDLVSNDDKPALAVEVRIGTDPFELRQILVTLHNLDTGKIPKVSVLGIDLSVGNGLQPGLLIDMVSQPGAYFVLSGQPLSKIKKLGSVSTDLWLKRPDGPTSAIRDADETTGDRAKNEPLLRITVKLKEEVKVNGDVIVLAGLHRGRGIFFQKLVGVIEDVNPSSTRFFQNMA